MNQSFVSEMQTLGFYLEDANTFTRTERSKGYDNDCSDDNRDDSFYDSRCDAFDIWANPIIKNVRECAKKHNVTISIDTSAEYGMIDVEVK